MMLGLPNWAPRPPLSHTDLSMKSQFAFASCQPGAEKLLKLEVESRLPAWRFSFSRPGFVTFKLPKETEVTRFEPPRLTFARTVGVSFDRKRVETESDLSAMVEWMASQPAVAEYAATKRPIWHVWQRDNSLPGDDGFEPGENDKTRSLSEAISKHFTASESLKDEPADDHGSDGEKPAKSLPVVFDAILVEPNECWLGAHAVRSRTDRWPGGVPKLTMPGHAVSRAYLKMQEGLRWSALPATKGDEWIELGCAPGGASQALLDAGMRVVGIDPAEVDPVLLGESRFRHLRMRTAETPRAELTNAKWLTADMNAAPSYTLEGVESIVNHQSIQLRGLLLTLKLLSPQLADPAKVKEVIDQIRSWGYGDVRVRQLAHNRREYCVAALRSRGQRRMTRRR